MFRERLFRCRVEAMQLPRAVIRGWRLRTGSAQPWSVSHGRTDLWSGEGRAYRTWLGSAPGSRRTPLLPAWLVWASFFGGLTVGYFFHDELARLAGYVIATARPLLTAAIASLPSLSAR